MRVRDAGSRLLLIGSLLAISLPLAARTASATTNKAPHSSGAAHTAHAAVHQTASTAGHATTGHWAHTIPLARGGMVAYRMASLHMIARNGGHAYARWGGGISCVPYARSASGIEVAGNAWQWWDNAAGRYARGSRPEPGSVLSFSANGRMRMGHVAVVSTVVNAREIEVDQANWWGPGMRGGVSRGVPVVDVSENNDWTAVRVGLGGSGEFGSVYPTNGFIYDRPDNGQMVAAISEPAPKPVLNPAPADLRPWAQRADYSQPFDEVAEAPPVVHAARRHTAVHHVRAAAQH
jgi:surface antigen